MKRRLETGVVQDVGLKNWPIGKPCPSCGREDTPDSAGNCKGCGAKKPNVAQVLVEEK